MIMQMIDEYDEEDKDEDIEEDIEEEEVVPVVMDAVDLENVAAASNKPKNDNLDSEDFAEPSYEDDDIDEIDDIDNDEDRDDLDEAYEEYEEYEEYVRTTLNKSDDIMPCRLRWRRGPRSRWRASLLPSSSCSPAPCSR